MNTDSAAAAARRIAIVTGAVEGIGFATAQILAERGHHTVLVGRLDDERLSGRVDELRSAGWSCEGVAADVSDPHAVARLYQHVFSSHRRLDVLVANAGILGDARVGMISESMLTSTIDVNVHGVIRHLQGAAKLMRRSGGGSIVLVSSIIGLAGNPGQVVYGASKAAVIGAMRSAAKELAPEHIRVNVVSPGFIATRMVSHLPQSIYDERVAGVPMGRAGDPREVAEVIAFLASPASAYVTGQAIGVDGGMVI